MKELGSLLPLLAIFVIFWLLVIRPASRRQREVRQVQAALGVGDEVITNGGIFGTVASLDDDRVGVRVAEGVVITVARPAIVGITRTDEADVPGDDETPDVEE